MAYFKNVSWRKYLLYFSLALAVLAAVYVYIAIYYNYSSGFRAGVIVKMSHKGFVFKTYEGQLYTGATSNNPNQARDVYGGNLWDFSVDRSDRKVVKDIEDAVATGNRVKLLYREKLLQFDWRGDTKYFVYAVEPIH
jgi:hypothetical protein